MKRTKLELNFRVFKLKSKIFMYQKIGTKMEKFEKFGSIFSSKLISLLHYFSNHVRKF